MVNRTSLFRIITPLLVLLVGGVVCIAYWHSSWLAEYTPIRRFSESPVGSVARLRGVVTYSDALRNRFWVQDGTGAIIIDESPVAVGVHAGEMVEVDAKKAEQPISSIRPIRVRRLTSRPLRLEPVELSLSNLSNFPKSGTLVAINGVVRRSNTDAYGRTHLLVAQSGPELDVCVAEPVANAEQFVNATIRIIGVPEERAGSENALPSRTVWVRSLDQQHVQEAPAQAKLHSIRSLFSDPSARNGHRISIRGHVSAIRDGSILVEDDWGALESSFDHSNGALKIGSEVEVTGFPSADGLRIDLFHAEVKQVRSPATATIPEVAPIRTVSDVRHLSPSEAAESLPVLIEGVVTYHDPIWRCLYVQDRTGGIYVKYSGSFPSLKAGDRLTVSGITNPGDYAPVIVAAKLREASAGHLPAPLHVSGKDAIAGRADAQFVVLEGIVHPMKFAEEPGHPVLTFELFTDFGHVHVYLSPFTNTQRALAFEDAKVSITGVFGTVFNSRRQLVGYQMQVASESDIHALEHGTSRPFDLPVTSISNLLRYSPTINSGHRQKIEGTVTYVGRDSLYVQDETAGVEVRGTIKNLKPGDSIEAIGYPSLAGRYSPVLSDATFRRKGSEEPVPPVATDAQAVLEGRYDAVLITVEGVLLTMVDSPNGKTLLLQAENRTFTADLTPAEPTSDIELLREGSRLQLTGVCSTHVDGERVYRLLTEKPESFKLLLRSARDLKIVKAAPFWTPRRTLNLTIACAALVLGVLTWVGVLRRRVRKQRIELEKAAETAQAVKDLSTAMRQVRVGQKFDFQVSVRGSEDIAQLVVGFNTMLTELQKREQAKAIAEVQLQCQALTDELTGLPNRRLFGDRLNQSLAVARRENRKVALLYIDLDGFKLVNDSLGHTFGDALLNQVAQRLKSRIRESDTLARLGGDEFTVVLNNIGSGKDAAAAGQNILDVFSSSFMVDGQEITIGASIGVSIFPDNGTQTSELLQQADSAMYAAKRGGKNQVTQFTTDLGSSVRERLTLENELRKALVEDRITVHYQPEFDLNTGTLIRFEALARWTHPTLGPIPPLKFIPVAEESGLIFPLGAYVMEHACREALRWQALVTRPVQVAVNVSSMQFMRDSFVDEVTATLERTGLAPNLLQIELTESAMLAGVERAGSIMQRLKKLGVTVVIDDFGTGYSCLTYLPRLSFDALKIDRSFVSELLVRPQTQALVKSILTLAHNLGMKVIVEGVETREQLTLIEELGGNEVQGYLLGRPTADPVTHLMQNSQLMRDEKRPPSMPLVGCVPSKVIQ